ncbi:phosphomannomutase/phosphoglucomutase [Salinibius halmophilus]|uniref:phosphomannomutase/phosphoglucomutase n=1 Tax=Salinibius halmophilus TaxID=1853216 RepID=UPI000E66ACF6|nr:phosphomannomutase/phosphoglucomutase [Salinibius halmophilus]
MKGKRDTGEEKHGKAKSINFIAAAIVLSIAVLAIVAWWLSATVLVRANQQTQSVVVENWTNTVQKGFDALYQAEREDFAELAQLSMVRTAIQSGNRGDFEQAERAIRSQRDEIVTISIHGMEQLTPNSARTPPLTFASIDLVNRTRRGQNVDAEAFNFQNRLLLNWAFSVRDNSGQVIGAIQVVSGSDRLRDYIQAQNPNFGTVSLVQRLPQVEPLTLFSAGQGSLAKASLPTSNPQWQLEFLPSPLISRSAELAPLTLQLPMIVAAILISIILAAAGLLLQARLQSDADKLAGWLQSAVEGRRVPSPKLSLALFANLAKQTAQAMQKGSTPVNPEQADIDLQPSDDTLPNADLMSAITGEAPVNTTPTVKKRTPLKPEIFRAYDIRGIYGENLDESVAEQIGLAVGSEAIDLNQQKIVVARDGRNSSPALHENLIAGLVKTGINVIDLGMVSTPMMYFASKHLQIGAGIMVTGSHNPVAHNGFKIVLGNRSLSGMDIQNLWRRASNEDFSQGKGSVSKHNIAIDYAKAIKDNISVHRRLKVVVDAGNGATAPFAGLILKELGCAVSMIGEQVDGNFPLRDPDPSQPDNLTELVKRVQENAADLGIAFDGDGDRMAVITSKGRYIWSDRVLALFAKQILKQTPDATIVYDVKCSRRLAGMIDSFGGKPIMWKSGHSLIKQQMQKTQATLGGEMTGHFFFADRWNGFDDGIYAAARLIELVSQSEMDADFLFSGFPDDPCTPEIIIPIADTEKFTLVEKLAERISDLPNARISTIDGVRVEFADGWGLVRPSNTTAAITCRFEADTEEALKRIQEDVSKQIRRIKADISLPF